MKVLLLLGCLRAAAADASTAPVAALDAPPGWSDVTVRTDVRGVVLALRGPEGSSFVVARMPASALDSAAATRAFLSRALDQLGRGAGVRFRPSGRVESAVFRNGLTAQLLRADAGGKAKLVVAALQTRPPLMAALASAAPDAMLEPLLGGLRLSGADAVLEAGTALSADGQLALPLGGGLRARPPTGEERLAGTVLVAQGGGSELAFVKDERTPPWAARAAGLRAGLAKDSGAPAESVSPALRAPTAAGPVAVYAWARDPASPDLRVALGALPWCYWSYTLRGRGPRADELLAAVLAALRAGPTAAPRLVAATPVPPEDGEGSGRRRLLVAGAAGALAALLLAAWSARRKKS